MPIYNVAKFIERALYSALGQTMPDIEYLLVDDRGNDDSMDIVRRIIAEHPRGKCVRIIENQKNCGLAYGRNICVKEASAPYVYFMDSDDEIPPEAIETLYKEMQCCHADVVQGGYKRVSGKFSIVHSADCNLRTKTDVLKAFFKENTYSISLWNKLYNKDFLIENNIRCIEGHQQEDAVFSVQVVQHAQYIRLVPKITYFYYINEGSLEIQRRNNFSERNFVNQDDIIRYFLDVMRQMDEQYAVLFRTNILQRVMRVKKEILSSIVLSRDDKKRMFAKLEEYKPVYNGVSCDTTVRLYRFIVQRPYRCQKLLIEMLDKTQSMVYSLYMWFMRIRQKG